jgi:hypothetical protein
MMNSDQKCSLNFEFRKSLEQERKSSLDQIS